MQEQLRRAIQQHQLIPPGSKVLVGVSGGADSLALLHTLASLQQSMGFALHVATLDHGWRGTQSANDTQFVVEFAKSLGVRVTAGQAPPEVMNGPPNEAAGRRARYNFFAEVAADTHADRVATAHHADDQAETVLLHLIRGAGMQGITGMRWQSPMPYHPSLMLIRPLLGTTRDQIEDYCQKHKLSPRQDPTNTDTHFLRNRVRLDILPLLAEINPNIQAALARLAETVAVDADYLQQTVQTLIANDFVDLSDSECRVDRNFFQSQHTAMQRRLLIAAVQHLNPTIDVDYVHIVAGVQIANEGQQGAIAEFPSGVQLRVNYDVLIVEHTSKSETSVPQIALEPGTSTLLTLEKPVDILNGRICLTLTPQPGWHILGIGYPPQNPQFRLRTRKPGDTITPPGMGGKTQTLKKWMINRKIPSLHRHYIPILTVNDHIYAVLHTDTGTITHPYHKPEDKRSQALALTWQPFDNA